MRTRVKICCISSHEEAVLAMEHDADAAGLVAGITSGPGCISNQLIADIAKSVYRSGRYKPG